jgi:hypothetical protein
VGEHALISNDAVTTVAEVSAHLSFVLGGVATRAIVHAASVAGLLLLLLVHGLELWLLVGKRGVVAGRHAILHLNWV